MSRERCMCGATDCISCGPAQGYSVVKVWDARLRRMVWRNPEVDEDGEEITTEEQVDESNEEAA